MPVKGEGCRYCAGEHWGRLMMAPEGNGSSGVMLMGEALGEHEEVDQLPFRPQAQAGSLLARALRMAGIPRETLSLTNAIWCRPPGNRLDGTDYEYSVVEHCSGYNSNLIEQRTPGVIVALGNVALRSLTDFTGQANEKQSVSFLRGWLVPCRRYSCDGSLVSPLSAKQRLWVLPTYHPSHIQRGAKELLGVLIHDLRLADWVSQHGVRVSNGTDGDAGAESGTAYQAHPSLEEARAFALRVRDNPLARLSFDIETPWGKVAAEDDDSKGGSHEIISVQFSLAPYTAIEFPWAGQYIDLARDILSSPNPKLGCNSWQYDEPILRANGCPVQGGHDDLRWAFHALYPDLPSNLQYICSFLSTEMTLITQHRYDPAIIGERPWKHTAQVIDSEYGLKDADWPQRVWPDLVAELQRVGAYPGYEKFTCRVRPILVRSSERGIPVSSEAHSRFGSALDEQIQKASKDLQAVVPDNLRLRQPSDGYKRDADAERCMAVATPEPGEKWVRRSFETPGGGVMRWVRLRPFNANSPVQVLAYMRSRGHKVPRDFDTGADTTGKAALMALYHRTKDEVYRLISDYRALTEMRGTHVEGWRPGLDGRVHPSFTFTPATGQIACYGRPNALNPPKSKGTGTKDILARSFRSMIQARPGCRLWEFDFQAAHSVTIGYEAEDESWMRLAKADIHSYLTAHLEGRKDPGLRAKAEQCLEWSDADLRAFLADVKRLYPHTRDDKAKPLILGYGFGMGWRKFHTMNEENFTSQAEAKHLHEMLTALFPKTAKWRNDIRALAHRQGFLLSQHGCIRWFWDVYHRRSGDDQIVPGEHSEAAIAFLPANDAFCHAKEILLGLDRECAWSDCAGLILYYHDALLFEIDSTVEDTYVPIIHEAMTSPSLVLQNKLAPAGLSLGVTVTCGSSWAEMEAVNVAHA